MGRTLAEKVWDEHVVRSAEGEPDLLYIDLHLVHEVTSPQAFDGLRLAKRGVRRPDLTLATMDHNVPTTSLLEPVKDPIGDLVGRPGATSYGGREIPVGSLDITYYRDDLTRIAHAPIVQRSDLEADVAGRVVHADVAKLDDVAGVWRQLCGARRRREPGTHDHRRLRVA